MPASTIPYQDTRDEGFRILFEKSPDAIFVEDEDGYILNANQAACELQEIEAGRLIGMNIRELVPAYEADAMLQRQKEWFRGGITYHEGIVYSATGRKIPVELHGRIVYFTSKPSLLLILRNITRRKEEEQQIRLEKLYFENLFKAAPEAIVITDKDSFIQRINNQFTAMFGYTATEVMGKRTGDFLVPREKISEAKLFFSGVKKGRLSIEQTVRIKKDGSDVNVSIVGAPIIMNDRQIGVFKLYRDITERLVYERKLEEARKKAVESDKLKSAFLANMSHEIRTPMNAIIGFSKLLETGDPANRDNEEYIEIIRNTGNTLLSLIDDIIDFARIEAGEVGIQMAACNVHEIMGQLYAYFERELLSLDKHDIEFLLNVPEGNELVIRTDPNRLRQILSNFLGNAIKFTSRGTVEMGYVIEEGNIVFYVRDTGLGIPADKHKVIFERFRQVESGKVGKAEGTGLGLAISQNLARLLGGGITLESTEGEGSVFSFHLPLVKLKSAEPKQGNPPVEMSNCNWKGKVILVVEDNELNSRLLQRMIEPAGAEVITACDGIRAIETFRENARIDIVLMDIQMPGMDGYEATRAIKSISPEVPVIAQTAYAMAEERQKIIGAGCDDYLCEPIKQKELFVIIDKYLNNLKP